MRKEVNKIEISNGKVLITSYNIVFTLRMIDEIDYKWNQANTSKKWFVYEIKKGCAQG